MTWTKLIGLVVVLAIGGSLLGAGQLTGGVVALVGIVGLLLVTINGGRPTRGGRGLGARSPRFLARWEAPSPRAVPAIVLAGFAAAQIMDAASVDDEVALIAVAALAAGFGILDAAEWRSPRPGHLMIVSAVLGFGGAVAEVLGVLGDEECRPSGPSTLAFVVSVAGGLAAFTVVRSGLVFVPPMRSRRSPGEWALTAFGLISLALFIAAPQGLRIWDEAPVWTLPIAVVLVVLVAGFAAFNVGLVELLVSIGLLAGTVVMVGAGASTGAAAACGRPAWSLALAGLFALVAALVNGIMPRFR